MPATSSFLTAVGSALSGTCRTETHTTTAASGRLMPKIQRQVVTSTIQPPRNGATAPAMPPRPDQAPIARPRSVPLNVAWMMASDPGVSSAPPTPWNARAALSTPIVGATAHSSDATANQTTPTRNTRRRPNRSPSEPPSSRNAASVRA